MKSKPATQRPVSENGDWGIPVLPVPQTKWDLTFSTDIIAKEKAHTYYPPFLYRNEHREYLNNPLVVPHTKLDKGADPYEEKKLCEIYSQ